MNRTDIHRPSVIEPSEYDFVACATTRPELGSAAFVLAERAIIEGHMKMTGGSYSRHEHGGTCHICGASAIYLMVFYHSATNTYIKTGEDCAAKMDMGDSRRFRIFRDAATAAMEHVAGKRKAEGILAAAGLSRAWSIYADGPATPTDSMGRVSYEEMTIVDIVGKLVKYGSISPKQEAFISKLITKIDERAPRAAAREAEKAAAASLPYCTGRMVIEGKVLSTKVQDTRFGTQVKMLVQHITGWKVWGTVPASIEGTEDGLKGHWVRFEAAIEASKDDPKFGFFSRPTKASVIDEVTEAAPIAPSAPAAPAITPAVKASLNADALAAVRATARAKAAPAPLVIPDHIEVPVIPATPRRRTFDPKAEEALVREMREEREAEAAIPGFDPFAALSAPTPAVSAPVWDMPHTPRETAGNAAIYLLNSIITDNRMDEMVFLTDAVSILTTAQAAL